MTTSLAAWMADLEARHLRDLTVAEVGRALRALSSSYVERRRRLASKGAFDSRGKRAAYALYYAPLHYITVTEIVAALDARQPARSLLDLGCGTGAAGAAWATALDPRPRVLGVDANRWALAEASRTYRLCGLDGSTRQVDATRLRLPRGIDALIAGWMLNEVDADTRAALQRAVLEAAERGCSVLVVEPIATRVAPWWDDWSKPLAARGARVDEWRFATEVPEIVRRLGRAAGLNPQDITARSLFASCDR